MISPAPLSVLKGPNVFPLAISPALGTSLFTLLLHTAAHWILYFHAFDYKLALHVNHVNLYFNQFDLVIPSITTVQYVILKVARCDLLRFTIAC